MSNFRQTVADELIKHIEQGTAPWQKPWKADVVRNAPFNPTSDKSYRGINAWWLDLQGHADPRWMTYRQAAAAGAQVRKGEKGTSVEYWKWTDTSPALDADGKPILDDTGKPKMVTARLERPKVFHAVVFNASQIDGLEPYIAPEPTFSPVERAEEVLAAGGVPIHHDQSDRAFYAPMRDSIHLPDKAAFPGAYEYYATALHELGHATGHERRLNRDFGPFGSELYAKEELRAEMASFMVATELGLGHYPDRHAAYVKSWLAALKDDHNLLFAAARDAEQIRTWVMEPEKRLALVPEKEKAQEQAMAPEQAAGVLLSGLPLDSLPGYTVVYNDRPGVAGAEVHTPENTIISFGGRTALEQFAAEHNLSERDIATLRAVDAQADKVQAVPVQATDQKEERAMAQPRPEQADRQFLAVAYSEKDQAKAAGARWDRRQKAWYAPEGADLTALSKWMPDQTHVQAPAKQAEPSPAVEFAEACRANGLLIDGEPQMDGKWHRVGVEGDTKGKASGSYRGFLDGKPAGQIMNYKTGEKVVQWVATGSRVDPVELERLKAESQARKAELARELATDQRQTGKRAYALWMNATPAEANHPYLEKKGIEAGELRQDKENNLLVQMKDTNGFAWNVQMIHPDGTKRYLKNGRKAGLMHTLPGKDGGPILIAEGYATAATLHQATGLTAVVAFDASNLVDVATALRAEHPDRPLVMAADDDHTRKINAGLNKAQEAANAVGATIIVPPLTTAEKAEGLTDWNDLAVKRGPDVVKAILDKELGLKPEKTRTAKTSKEKMAPAPAL